MKPYLSIVIATYNSAKTLPALLNSVLASKIKNYELILVDDGSTDETREVVQKFKKVGYFCIENSGPGKARDFGAQKAKGEILVFFDSDVVLFPETLKNIVKAFAKEEVKAVTGIWDKKQKRRDFFPRYKALRDWSYWLNEDFGKFSYLFSTRVAAIRKKTYQEVGGFIQEEKGRDALEDINISFRINRQNFIYFDPKIKVRHEFGDYKELIEKYFKRSFKWTKIFLLYRKLNRTVITPWEAVAGMVIVLSLVFWFLGIVWPPFWLVALGLLLFHLYLERRFLAFVFREEGLIFTIKSVLVGFIIYPTIYAGAGFSLLHSGLRFLKKGFLAL